MSNYVDALLRRYVAERANHIYEYCLIHEEDTYFGCEVDHIISVKHGGETTPDNLAFACAFCNRHKGSDIGSIYWPTGELVRFFNPRIDYWSNHFRLDGTLIKPISDIGEVTTRILNLNGGERILERQILIELGRYPSTQAQKHLRPF
jgi:hypothetical protein